MLLRTSLIISIIFLSIWAKAQFKSQIYEISEAEAKVFQSNQNREEHSTFELIDRTYFDVEKQTLEFDVDPTVKEIKGKVTTFFNATRTGYKSIILDLTNKLIIDSIYSPNNSITWKHEKGFIDIQFSNEFSLDQPYAVVIHYHGIPNGGRSFSTDTTKAGSPVLWTLSEPYSSKEWWPCKQDLQDKINNLNVTIRNPEKYKAVSNGTKVSEIVLPGGIRETWFEHNYPIVSYLVAIAVADYKEFRDTINFDGVQMPFINYVYPESEAEAKEELKNFNRTILLFDSLFGDYPFKKEHYGHAQFTWGGGMEHQTMSFMFNFNHGLVAHELAHQWFGDKVTCATWQDLWLNEGFATYLTGLTYDFLFEENYWIGWKQDVLSEVLKNGHGSVFIEDTTDVGRMFNAQLTYFKGAYLLHMLRWKMGNDAFFSAIKAYANDPELAYGFAKTENLMFHLKQAGGKEIDEFFNDWFYRKGWPTYQIQWYQDNSNKLYVVVNQEQSYIWEGTFFDMVLPVNLVGFGYDSLLRLDNNTPNQEYIIPLDFKIESFSFDPELWLISGENKVEKVNYKHELIGYKIAPNPVINELIVYSTSPNLPNSKMEIYNMDGSIVWRGDVEQGLSSKGFSINLDKLKPGVYFLSVSDYYSTSLHKFIKM